MINWKNWSRSTKMVDLTQVFKDMKRSTCTLNRLDEPDNYCDWCAREKHGTTASEWITRLIHVLWLPSVFVQCSGDSVFLATTTIVWLGSKMAKYCLIFGRKVICCVDDSVVGVYCWCYEMCVCVAEWVLYFPIKAHGKGNFAWFPCSLLTLSATVLYISMLSQERRVGEESCSSRSAFGDESNVILHKKLQRAKDIYSSLT